MIIFILIASLTTLLVLFWILRPLLQAFQTNTDSRITSKLSGKHTAAVITIILPLGTTAMYLWLGPISLLDTSNSANTNAQIQNDPQIAHMVNKLSDKLKAKPGNPQGWTMLVRTYRVMGQFDKAEAAYHQAKSFNNSAPTLEREYEELQKAIASAK